MLRRAAHDADVDRAHLAAAFPGGVIDVLRYWSLLADETMGGGMAASEFATLKVREKVAGAISLRLGALSAHKESARRAAATLALPPYVGLGARLAWATSDAIWRGLGDKSTDFNFYTKRATLFAVWTSTFARWLADDSAEEAETSAFLARRIENVMQIEKLKAEARKVALDPDRLFGALAKLRYPAPRV